MIVDNAMLEYVRGAGFSEDSYGIFRKGLSPTRIYVDFYYRTVAISGRTFFEMTPSVVHFSTLEELELAVIYQTLRVNNITHK